MSKKWKAFLCICAVLAMASACGKDAEGKENTAKASTESTVAAKTTESETSSDISTEISTEISSDPTDAGIQVSVWPTYWDSDTVLQEMNVLQDKIDNVCYFAAYFDANQKPFIPEQSLQTYAAAKQQFAGKNWKSYLTIVNDLMLPEGGSSLKDTQLLYTLLQDPTARKAHINEILNLATLNGFNGIEIDYEAIRKDMTLWGIFNQFITELNAEAQNRGIAVRVLFEPSVPVEQLSLPEGPEYVLMCYNLYGHGTEPGPKANRDFLIQMVQLLEKMPAPRNMALSIGGFDFAADGTVTQLTEVECVTLLNQYNATARRDESSEDVVFNYTDAAGMKHEVWYADNSTLSYWMSIGKTYGINHFSIWRLGRNVTLNIDVIGK